MAKHAVTVTLAGEEYIVKIIPMAKVKKLGELVAEALQDEAVIDEKDLAGTAQSVVDQLMAMPHAILSLFIPNLPKEIFTDEENGVTLPEFIEALETCAKVNRIDWVKNLLSRAAPYLLDFMKTRMAALPTKN
jgi:hypothetical protein